MICLIDDDIQNDKGEAIIRKCNWAADMTGWCETIRCYLNANKNTEIWWTNTAIGGSLDES